MHDLSIGKHKRYCCTTASPLTESNTVMGKYATAMNSSEFGQIALTTVELGTAKYPLCSFYVNVYNKVLKTV